MIPVMMSTLSRFMKRLATCSAFPGLRASSSTNSSTGVPPSLPPSCSRASLKPSRTATPKALPPPDRVVIMPTFTWAASVAGAATNSIVIKAIIHLRNCKPSFLREFGYRTS